MTRNKCKLLSLLVIILNILLYPTRPDRRSVAIHVERSSRVLTQMHFMLCRRIRTPLQEGQIGTSYTTQPSLTSELLLLYVDVGTCAFSSSKGLITGLRCCCLSISWQKTVIMRDRLCSPIGLLHWYSVSAAESKKSLAVRPTIANITEAFI